MADPVIIKDPDNRLTKELKIVFLTSNVSNSNGNSEELERKI